jgi:hypothetical protein
MIKVNFIRRRLLIAGTSVAAASGTLAAIHDGEPGAPPQTIRGAIPWEEGAADAPPEIAGSDFKYFTNEGRAFIEAAIERLKICTTWIFALVLTGELAGCATYGRCGSSDCSSDAIITARVETAFAQHPNEIAPNSIEVRTVNHVVYLSGATSNELMTVKAESIAGGVSGVTRVVDSIYVPH